jgi:hypothetical protein
MSIANLTRPWIIGSLAVYAGNIHAARSVYELVSHQEEHDAFGTITLDTGEDVDWVDMCNIKRQPDSQ